MQTIVVVVALLVGLALALVLVALIGFALLYVAFVFVGGVLVLIDKFRTDKHSDCPD